MSVKGDVAVTKDLDLVMNGTTLNGSNISELLKKAAAKNDLKGQEPHGLANFFSILHGLSLTSSFLSNNKQRRMLTTISAAARACIRMLNLNAFGLVGTLGCWVIVAYIFVNFNAVE